ncbi:hypothetical protein IEJ02_11020 [Streptomyces sp. 5-10]|nr:hypothetical protein [Streptomyces sp. 5-10]
MATLEVMMRVADDLRTGDLDGPGYRELYAFLPGYNGLIRCELSLAGSDKHPKMIVVADEVPQDSGFVPGML